jgi:hypothetical protein
VASERSIKDAIVAELRRQGAYVLVTTGVSDVGTPDIIACHNGRFYAFEVKNETGRMSKMQLHRLLQIGDSGGTGAMVRSVSDVLYVLAGFVPIKNEPASADAPLREEQQDEGGVHSV